MNFWEYQNQSSRTLNKNRSMAEQLSNYCMGLSGESGEVVDELKKVLFHGHDLNIDEIEKELGDVLWYVAAIATTLGIELNQIAHKNVEKLKGRYPDGFFEKDSIDRKELEESGAH